MASVREGSGQSVTAPDPKRHLTPLVSLAALTAGVLWPAVRHFTTRPMIGRYDSSIFLWAWWNLYRSIGAGRSPFHTYLLFHPVGVDLSVTVTAPAIALTSWPLRALLGTEAQINAVELGAFFLSAVLCYFLALRTCRRRSVAAMAGAAFAGSPYMVAHMGEHLNLIHIWVLPGCLLIALRMMERPSVGRAAWLGGALGLTALVEPQLAVFTTIAVVVLLVRRWDGAPPRWSVIMVAAATAAVVAAPVVIPMAVGLLGNASSPPLPARALSTYSARPSSWLFPAPWHPWFGYLTNSGALYTPSEGVAGPSLVVLALAVMGRRTAPPAARRGWVALFWTGAVLSLGPFLAFGESVTSIPLPYYLFRLLPFMSTVRAPGRLAVLGILALCVLAAQAADALLDRVPVRRRLVPLLIVPLVLAVELLPGALPSRAGAAPAPYAAIAADPGEGAVLELPIQWLTGTDVVGYRDDNLSIFEAWATVHGKALVSGSVSRLPDAAVERLDAVPVYRQVRFLQGDAGVDDEPVFTGADLAESGIGYVVYHRDIPMPRVLAYMEGLALPVLADDGVVIVWRVPAT